MLFWHEWEIVSSFLWKDAMNSQELHSPREGFPADVPRMLCISSQQKQPELLKP